MFVVVLLFKHAIVFGFRYEQKITTNSLLATATLVEAMTQIYLLLVGCNEPEFCMPLVGRNEPEILADIESRWPRIAC